MTEITDRALVTSALDGDAAAFAGLVERYTRSVHALVYSRLLDHGDAEDATQETFLRAYSALGRLRHPDIFEAWLHRIALSCAYDRLRKRARETVTDVSELLADAPIESTDMAALERREDVMPVVTRALGTLPEALRGPLLMRYLADAPYDAIGRRLHISESAARKRVERAIARVRDYIARSGGEISVRQIGLLVAPACPLPSHVAGEVTRALRSVNPPARGDTGTGAARPPLVVAAASASLVTAALTVGVFLAQLTSAPRAGGVAELGTPLVLYDVEGVSRTVVTRPGVVRLVQQDYNDLPRGARPSGWTSGVEAAADPTGERASGVAKVSTNLPAAYYEFPLTRGVVTVEMWMKAAPAPDSGMGLRVGNHLAGTRVGEDASLVQALAQKNTSGPWLYTDGVGPDSRRVEFHQEDGRWHHVKAVITTSANEYDLYFDDRLVGSRVRSAADLSAGISMVGVSSGRWRYDDDIPSYFDDLRVTATLVDESPLVVGEPWEHGSPVLAASQGDFDGRGVSDPCVVYADGAYHMWYVGHREWDPAQPARSRMTHIGYATSRDGTSWTKRGVVLAPDPTTWDSHQVAAPSVIRRGVGYEMWYSGNAAPKVTFGVGRATSPDGVHWTRDASNPVLHHGDAPDRGYPELGSVAFADGRYHMWYGATLDNGSRVIRYATSVDGSRWSDVGVALTPTGDAGWDAHVLRDADVARVGDRWEMWYAGFGEHSSGIGRATSDDGLVWARDASNPLLTAGPPGHWTYPAVHQPSVIDDGSRRRLWHVGGGSLRQIGHAFVNRLGHREPFEDARRDLISRVGP